MNSILLVRGRLIILVCLLCQHLFAQVPSYVPASGLVAYYSLNGNLNDVSGAGNNATPYGTIAYGTDRFGTALSCYKGNGAGEGDIPVNTFPTGNAARTISVFYKYKLPYAGGGRAFFGWGNNIFAGRFSLFASDTYVGVEYVNGVVRVASYTVDSCWHNLTVTYPSSGGGSSAVKLYLDGYLVASSVILPTSSYSTPSGPWHGLGGNIYYLPAYTDSWTGFLDDIGVWNRELTATEVLQLWTGGGYPTTTGAVSLTGANTLCQGASTVLSASLAGGSWSVSSPAVATVVGGTVTGLSAGTTIITYSAVVGCVTVTDTQMITVAPVPVAPPVAGPSSLCQGNSAAFTTTGSGGTWSSSAPTVLTINSSSGISGGVSSGVAIVSYTVSNACGSATDTQLVTVMPLPVAGTVSGPSTVCPGTSIVYSATGSAGSWSSSNPAILTVNAASGIGGGVATGTAIISYSVTNTCSTATDTLLVNVYNIPSAGVIYGPSSVCVGSVITLLDGITGGTWSTSDPSIATVGASSGVVGGVAAGIVTISYTVSNSCGIATATAPLTVNAMPDAGVIVGMRDVCEGSSLTLTDMVPGGTWSSSAVSVASVGGGVVSGLLAGNTVISYSVTNVCGTIADTHAIVVHPRPDAGVIAGSTTTLCEGLALSLTSSTPGGVWGSSNSSVASINSSGVLFSSGTGVATLYYIVNNSYGCGDTAAYTLTIVSAASLNTTAVVEGPKCYDSANGSIALSVAGGSGSYAYSWSNGSLTPSISGLSSGAFSVMINDMITGCADTQQYYLQPPVTMAVNELVTNSSCGKGNGSIVLTDVTGGTAPYSFYWSDGSTASSLFNVPSGTYILTITDSKQCTLYFNGVVGEDSCYEILIHDVITPNGDGINDIWIIEGIGNYPNNSVAVFDKWGDEIFAEKGYNNTWRGTSANGMVPSGTYIYLVKPDAAGAIKPITGTLLIKH